MRGMRSEGCELEDVDMAGVEAGRKREYNVEYRPRSSQDVV